MSLTLKNGATGMSVTAGSDLIFTAFPDEVKGGMLFMDTAEADLRIQKIIVCQHKRSAYDNRTNVFTRGKWINKITAPKILADGSICFNYIRTEAFVHPETTAAERLNIWLLSAQLATNSGLNDFRNLGSIPA